MIPEIGLLDLAAGALIVLGIFAAFMVWLVFPILGYLLVGATYATARHAVPAFERVSLAALGGVVQSLRRAATPLALWILREASPVYGRVQRRRD